MSGDQRVQQLIEEILESGSTVEEVCRDSPDLLPQVREGWRKLRAIQAQLGELFPERGSTEDFDPTLSLEIGLPQVPGYDISEVLGRGGVGVVYKALHRSLNRTVALKMLLAGAWATRAERQRFSREAEVVAKLRHPNIVQIHDVGDLDGRPYFTMEFVEGGTLAGFLAGTPRPGREAAELVATLAGAIHAAHQSGIVHRDLKPSNVLLTADGTPKISDFGLARHIEVGPTLTQSGAAVGTPSYMAPEQARGKPHETGPPADLYALGAVLYELLTGRPPFRAESAAETLHQVITRDPVPPSRLNAKVSKDLETICLKCLRKDPKLRYADAEALAEDLGRFLRGETIAARPENRLERLARRIRRRPGFSAVIAVVTLVTLAMVGAGLWLISERAATARISRAEWMERERASADDLREMARLLEKSAGPEAAAALERARGRLGKNGGSPELRQRLDQGARDLRLLTQLDDISSQGAGSEGGQPSFKRSIEACRQAFQEAGLGWLEDDPKTVAGRIRASSIKNALLITLDECAFIALDKVKVKWFLSVAQFADNNPTGWRYQTREEDIWEDNAKFVAMLETAPIADLSVPSLLAMSYHLPETDKALLLLLKRIQQAHPTEYRANLRLAEVLRKNGNPAESIRYYQAALATRPMAGFVYFELGNSLLALSRYEEAEQMFRKAVRIDPKAGRGHHSLAIALQYLYRNDEAIEQSRIAINYNPEVAVLYLVLARGLEAKGRHEEAIDAYRTTLRLDPKMEYAPEELRALMIRQGRADEARVAWEKVLASRPPAHKDWYGYAELCLFLGLENEYRQARQALLAQFGTITDPYLAERTARACLLRPVSGEELSQVVALGEHAWGVERSKYPGVYPYFLFLRALAEYRQGNLDRAIAMMQGDAGRVLGPSPRLVLAMAQHRSGRAAEARKTLASAVPAYDWRATEARDQDGWICHALRCEAENLILPNLPAFLEGNVQPSSQEERLSLLGVCEFKGLHHALARLYQEAFEADPKLAETVNSQIRFKAACSASRVGSGRSADAANLSDPERMHWRKQARDWLRAEMASMARHTASQDPNVRAFHSSIQARWIAGPDLAELRDPDASAKLSPAERQECQDLWSDFRALFKEVK